VPRTFAVVNQKGGVGKTTTAINLASGLARAGFSTLLVDLDPQGNATTGLGVAKSGLTHTTYHAMIEGHALQPLAIESVPGLDLEPAHVDLAGAELELAQLPAGREGRLREALRGLDGRYAFVLLDCPPSLGLLTVNALVAADAVLLPVQCEFFALEGLGQLLTTVGRVRDAWNPALSVAGVLVTQYDSRTTLSRQVVSEVRSHCPVPVFRAVVPRNVRLSEAPSHGLPIWLYDPSCTGAKAYAELTAEVIALA
jgi:chromosome partitioning protein